MDRDEANIAKRELCEKLLTPGTVMLVVDTRRHGVTVPSHLAGDPKLRLNIDYRFGAAMTVDDWGVNATLSFGGDEFDCVLPWEAIYVLMPHTSSQPYVFPDDVPNEVLDEIGVEAKGGVGPRPALRLVGDPDSVLAPNSVPPPRPTEAPRSVPANEAAPRGAEVTEPDADDPESDPSTEPPPGKRRGHLRVVK